jgi:ATP-dependent DNA helicase RecG
LLDAYLASCRARSERLAASDPDTVLLRTSVIDPEGWLTLAGLYALGAYPQQVFPSLAIVTRAMPMTNDPPGTRAADLGAFDGPLPEMLERAMAWVRRNTATRVRFGPDGHAFDEPTYPPEAVRELVANALVHRDLGPHSRGAHGRQYVSRHVAKSISIRQTRQPFEILTSQERVVWNEAGERPSATTEPA